MSLSNNAPESYGDLLKLYKINEHGPGFHGDINLIKLVDSLLSICINFVETGCNLGNTLYFVSRNYSNKCFSCEIGNQTPKHIYETKDIFFRRMSSPDFLYLLKKEISDIGKENCLFFLDAHSDTQSVWKTEVEFIINNFDKYYVIIDDFDIDNQLFYHNGYSIKDLKILLNDTEHKILIPNYSDQTSEFHHLTGWILFTNDKDFTHQNAKEIKL